MSAGPTLVDRCVVGADVEAYGRRNVRQQRDIQRDLRVLMAEAAQAAGLDPTAWEVFPTGDGEHAVLPAGVNLLAVVGGFVPVLHDLLVLRNEDREPGAKIRLSVAVHTGALTPGAGDRYAGVALLELGRLLDSTPVRRALARSDRSALALILSTAVYEKVVSSGLLVVRDGDFAEVEVEERPPGEGVRWAAYVHVPGQDMRTLAPEVLDPGGMSGASPPPGRARPPGVQAGPGAIVVNGDFVVGGNVDTSITTHLGPGAHGEAPL